MGKKKNDSSDRDTSKNKESFSRNVNFNSKPLSTKSTSSSISSVTFSNPNQTQVKSSSSRTSRSIPAAQNLKVAVTEGKSGAGPRTNGTGGESDPAFRPENGPGLSSRASSAEVGVHSSKLPTSRGCLGGDSPGRGAPDPSSLRTLSSVIATEVEGGDGHHGSSFGRSEANLSISGGKPVDALQKLVDPPSSSESNTDPFGDSSSSERESPVRKSNKSSSGRRSRGRPSGRNSGEKRKERNRRRYRSSTRSPSCSPSPHYRYDHEKRSRGRKRSRCHGSCKRHDASSASESPYSPSRSLSPIQKRKKRPSKKVRRRDSSPTLTKHQDSYSSNFANQQEDSVSQQPNYAPSALDPEFFTQDLSQDDLQVDFDDPEELDPNISFKDLVRRRTAFNLKVMSNHLNDLERVDFVRPTSSGIGRFKISDHSNSHSYRLGLSESSKHSFKLAEQLIRMDKFPRRRILYDKYAEPDRNEAPVLETVSKSFSVVAKDQAWPIFIADESLPFQNFSKPSFHEASYFRPPEQISFPAKDFNKLEKLSSDIVKGVSLQSSLLETLFSILGQVQSDDQGRSFFSVRPSDQIDQTAVAHMVDAIVKTNENLSYAASQVRVQEGAAYRDHYLKDSSFTKQDRSLLRSLPLSANSLWEKKWFDFFIEKSKVQKKAQIEDFWLSQIPSGSGNNKNAPFKPGQGNKQTQNKTKPVQKSSSQRQPLVPNPPPFVNNAQTNQNQQKGRGRGRGKQTSSTNQSTKKPGSRQPQSFL